VEEKTGKKRAELAARTPIGLRAGKASAVADKGWATALNGAAM
jgi:hypothetical protein